MKLSIVVGTYNRKDQIQRCVESIQAETQTSYCLYITDGGSTDGTIEYLQSVASETIVPIFVGQLLGQAKAYNDVFAQVETPFVCWLSDDNVVVNGGLDIALRVLERNHQIGMVGLKTKDVLGPFVDAPYIGGISDIGILNVNQGMLRTSVLRGVGNFSEVFKDYGIDPDLTAKVLFSGHDVVYTRAVALHHYRNWSADPASPDHHALKRKHERARRLYQLKYARWRTDTFRLRTKRYVLSLIKKQSGNRQLIHSAKKFAGGLPRDWFNALNGRFISVLDPLLYARRDFHLVQRCSRRLLPASLPAEPDDDAAK